MLQILGIQPFSGQIRIPRQDTDDRDKYVLFAKVATTL
jgi:hypothetical protein